MDVDGTLTDGKIYMGSDGEAMKAFNIKDGCGLSQILPKYNIIPIIITARESKILENRCHELNITEFYQKSKDKLSTLTSILKNYNADLSSVAYIGDDLADLEVMKAVKVSGGAILCPADAIPQIRNIADYISPIKAGDGAVRDCIDSYLLRSKEENVLEAKFDMKESFLELYNNFKQLLTLHNPTLSHAPLTSISFTAFLFSDCIKQDVETILTLKENNNTPTRYSEGIIRNICEQVIEFIYLHRNPSLLPDYYGTNEQIEPNSITVISAIRRSINRCDTIHDMAVAINEETGTADELSLYEAYLFLHDSYMTSFMELFDAVASIQKGEVSSDGNIDFLILSTALRKFMEAYKSVAR